MILLHTKLVRVPDVIFTSALALIHFVKYSRATAAKRRFLGAVGNGATISTPHLYKGHVGKIELVGLARAFWFLVNIWQPSQLWTNSFVFLLLLVSRTPTSSIYGRFHAAPYEPRTFQRAFRSAVGFPTICLCISTLVRQFHFCTALLLQWSIVSSWSSFYLLHVCFVVHRFHWDMWKWVISSLRLWWHVILLGVPLLVLLPW